MQLSFLFLAFASLTFAQLWPLDFGDVNDKSTGSPVWLEPGTHTALVGEDLSNAFVEFTFKPTFAAHTCEYRVISDDTILFSGSFRNSIATIIPSMLNTFSATTTEISVWTKGCSLNRFALPFTYGANGASVYLLDVSPTAQAKVNVSVPASNIGFTTPNTPESYDAFDQWRFSNGADDTSSFSTQVTRLLPQENDGWWFTRALGGLGDSSDLIVDYSNIAPFNNGSDFVLDWSYYTRWGTEITTAIYGCANSTDCSDYNNFLATNLLYKSRIVSQNEETSRLFLGTWSPPAREAKASTLKHQVVYALIEADVMKANSFVNSLLITRPSSILNQVAPPYLKLWTLDSSATSDPNHVVIDLRSVSGGLCTIIDPQTTDPVYAKLSAWDSGGTGDFISGGGFEEFGPANTLGINQGWIQCPNDAAGLLTLISQPTDCSALSNIVKFDETISTNTFTLDVSYPDGAFFSVPIFDGGLKLLSNAGNCFTPLYDPGTGLAPFYLSQVSNFDVVVNGVTIGEVKQNALENNFVGRSYSLGTSTNFIADPSDGPSVSFLFKSKPGFSIDAWPWAFIHKLPPADLCNSSSCVNGGVCLNPAYSTKCVTPSSQGGEPAETTNPYINGVLTGLFTGDANDVPVPYCTNNPCVNGGVCVENLNRFWNAELYGTGAADNVTYCDCSGVNRTTVTGQPGATGPYWGDLCQYAPPCDSNPCLNGGKCINGDRSQFTCDCSSTLSAGGVNPYTGDRCEVSGTLPCDFNPCGNGGTCVNDRFNSFGFTCDCAGGWSGHACDIPPVDNCLLTPDTCGEYGVCIPSLDPLRNYVQCACLFGYSGPTCGNPPAICQDACDNGGACISHPDSTGTTTIAACLCPAPWVGDRCQWNSTIWATA